MLRAMRHDVWATEKLIVHLRSLDQHQLQLTARGTFGPIIRTLMHLIAADERYLRRFFPMPEPLIDDDRGPDMPLDDLERHLRNVKDGVERLFAAPAFDPDRVIRDARRRNPADPPLLITGWVLLTQFVHHGSDHRAHIGTILGANGIAAPDLDGWAYGTELDAVKEEA
jgi:uncharacterized damage-inducible protein DinB